MHVTATNIMNGRTAIATSGVVPEADIRCRRIIAPTSIVKPLTASNAGIHPSGKDKGKRRTDNRYASDVVKRLTGRRAGNASATPVSRISVGGITDRQRWERTGGTQSLASSRCATSGLPAVIAQPHEERAPRRAVARSGGVVLIQDIVELHGE